MMDHVQPLLVCGQLLFAAVVGFGGESPTSPLTLEGMWSGEDTNDVRGLSPGALYAFKLNKSGQGASYMGSQVGIVGTFTYRLLSQGELVCSFNDSPDFKGTLHYDASTDTLTYQESEAVARALGRGVGPLALRRDTNANLKAMLDSVVGATNDQEVMTRLGRFFAPILGEHDRIRGAYRQEQAGAQPDAAHEPPPAGAARESSETMNTNTQSETPADDGGR